MVILFVYFLLFISTDPQIEALVTELVEPLAEFRLQVVGRSFVRLDESQSRCRLGECNIGKTCALSCNTVSAHVTVRVRVISIPRKLALFPVIFVA